MALKFKHFENCIVNTRIIVKCGAEEGWGRSARNEEVLHRANEEGDILHTVKRKMAKQIVHILCKNCLLKQVVEGEIGRIGVTGRRGRRRKQLLNDINLLKTKRNLLYIRNQFVPHSKHFPPQL